MAQNSFNPGSTIYNQFSNPTVNISLDNLRREYLGDILYALTPEMTPFFAMMSRFRKQSFHSPIIKSMEVRHQWQRRNFTAGSTLGGSGVNPEIRLSAPYDKRGKTVDLSVAGTYRYPAYFVMPNAVVQISGVSTAANGSGILTAGVVSVGTITEINSADGYLPVTLKSLYHISDTGVKTADPVITAIAANSVGMVMGSAYAENTSYGSGWADVIGQAEGYMQIFKTVNDMWSGTMQATEYRGIKDEAMRQWIEKQNEHKMDINQAMMFGVGRIDATSGQPNNTTQDNTAMDKLRYTWGIIPYLQHFGKTEAFSYASSGYDDFVDFLQSFFAPEEGNSGSKLVVASRKIIGWINKIGNGNSFLGNTLLADTLKLDVQNVKSVFGFTMLKVNCVFGELNFIAEPLLRGIYENYAVVLDPKNICYRYLAGNGISRDTWVEKDVQAPGTDGKVDLITTEAGMEILLPETHRILVWS